MAGVGDVVGGLADETDKAPDDGTGQNRAWFTWRGGCQEMYLSEGSETDSLLPSPTVQSRVFHTRYKCNEAPGKSTRRTTDIRLLPRRCLSVL